MTEQLAARRHYFLCFVAVIAASLMQSSPVLATFPGTNGLIVFDSNRDGNTEIYVTNPDGTDQTNLTNNPAEDTGPAWSPDGSKVAFSSNRDGNAEIYLMNADGSGVTRVTNNAATDIMPAWSPDGLEIAFARFGSNYDIWKMNADGTDPAQLTNHPLEDLEPTWSPDGSKIAFTAFRGVFPLFDHDIYVMNAADGSGLTNLSNDPAADASPDWSPDGSQILFATLRTGSAALWVMQADGTGQTPLTATPNGDSSPAWSPDGTKIVFTSFRDFNQELYVMDADGSAPVRLTNNAPPGQTVPEDRNADWQPLAPPTIESGIDRLIQDVMDLNLPAGTETALLAHLHVARRQATDGITANDAAATGAVQAFINQLLGVPVLVDEDAQPIPETHRAALIQAARGLIDRLEA